MHQSNVLDWYENEFSVKVCNSTRKMTDRKEDRNKCIIRIISWTINNIMIDVGEVMSGFKVKGPNNIYVVYKQKQRSGYINLLYIKRQNKGVGKIVLGLEYVECE